MKLTKTKNAKEAFFYRDAEKGELRVHKFPEIKTEDVIGDLPSKSIIGRILAKPKDKDSRENTNTPNEFEEFIGNLIESGITNLPDIEWIHGKEFPVTKYFSPYGCMLTIEKDGETLKQVLKRHYEKHDDIQEELCKLRETLQNRITYKKERLKTSITNNRIQLPLHSTSLSNQNNNRANWLFDFIIGNGKFDTYWKWYNYANLCEKLKPIVKDNYPDKIKFDAERFKKELLKFGGTVYDKVKQYNKELYQQQKVSMKPEESQKEMQQYIFYLREVQAYFRHYFGSKGANKKLDTLEKVNVLIGIEEKDLNKNSTARYPEIWIKEHITNQITALLIQNGKLDYYGKTENPTSDDLLNIKIEEAFKKQLFLSLAWAITRLNYFFDYENLKNKHLSEPSMQGDILLEFSKDHTLWDEYQFIVEQQNTKLYIKPFIKWFLTKLSNNNDYIEEFREKICTTFPTSIENVFPNEEIHKLLDMILSISLYTFFSRILDLRCILQ